MQWEYSQPPILPSPDFRWVVNDMTLPISLNRHGNWGFLKFTGKVNKKMGQLPREKFNRPRKKVGRLHFFRDDCFIFFLFVTDSFCLYSYSMAEAVWAASPVEKTLAGIISGAGVIFKVVTGGVGLLGPLTKAQGHTLFDF